MVGETAALAGEGVKDKGPLVTGNRAAGTRMSFGHACMHTNIQKSLQEILTDKKCGPEKEQGASPQGDKTCWKLDSPSTCCRKILCLCFVHRLICWQQTLIPSLFSPPSSDFTHWGLEV